MRRSKNLAKPPSGGGVLYMPPLGRMLNVKDRSRMSRMPVHHAGSAKEIAEPNETARSILLPTRVAIFTPTAMPMTAVMIRLEVSSRAVFGSRSNTMSDTLRLPLELLSVRASPRSRVMTRKTVSGIRCHQTRFSP